MSTMVIRFNPSGPNSVWNLQMARMIHMLWEMCQLNAVNLPYSPLGGAYRPYVMLEDYRIPSKFTL